MNLRKYCIAMVLLFLSAIKIVAQESDVKAFAIYENSEVKIRWIIDNKQNYKSILTNGMTVYRKTVSIDGVKLDEVAHQNSLVVLDENIKVGTAAELNNLGSDFAAVGKEVFYPSQAAVDPTNIEEFLDRQQKSNGEMFFLYFAAEQDFELAKLLGLGFEDSSIQANREYIYTILPNHNTGDYNPGMAEVIINTAMSQSMPAINSLAAIGQVEEIMLSWIQDQNTVYTGYNIYRRESGGVFERLNDLPYTYMRDMQDDGFDVQYIDTATAVGTEYEYYINGITPFGTESEMSVVVTAIALPPRIIPFDIKIDSTEVLNYDSEVYLQWTLPDSLASVVTGFDVMRSDARMNKFDKVNSSILASGDRSYIDNTPISSGYYKVVAVDENDYRYPTAVTLVQLPDTIPPAVPVGLSGTYISDSELQLSWDANTEEDLKGYRIVTANQRNGNYVQVTTSAIGVEQFITYTDPNVEGDSIFVKIFAEDQRQNYSERSEPIGISRPDNIGPSKPVFKKVMPYGAGIGLSFGFSSSSDVVQHYVERKPVGVPGWTKILIIAAGEEQNFCNDPDAAYCHVDEYDMEPREYEYRFVAEDDSGNLSSSSIRKASPLLGAVNGDVINLTAQVTEQEQVVNSLVTQQLYNINKKLGRQNYRSASQQTEYSVLLNWEYEITPNVLEFQLLRGSTGNPLQVYRTISLEDAMGLVDSDVEIVGAAGLIQLSYTDEEVLNGRRYAYQLYAKHVDGTTSEDSNLVAVKIPE